MYVSYLKKNQLHVCSDTRINQNKVLLFILFINKYYKLLIVSKFVNINVLIY